MQKCCCGFYFFETGSNSWQPTQVITTFISDEDADTRIETEKNVDEDLIRMSLAGSEKLVLQKNNGSLISRMQLVNNNGNISIGDSSAFNATTAHDNIAIGKSAMKQNLLSSDLIAIGTNALMVNNDGFGLNKSIGIGFESLKNKEVKCFYFFYFLSLMVFLFSFSL